MVEVDLYLLHVRIGAVNDGNKSDTSHAHRFV